MSRRTFTTAFLNHVKPPPGDKRAEFRDTTPGLTLRVNDRGVRTWTLTYRVSGAGGKNEDGRPLQGRTRRLNIGRYPALGLRAARDRADELWSLAADGTDPAAQRHREVMDRRETEQLTFRVLAERWIDEAERGRRVGRQGAISPGYLRERRGDLAIMVMPHLGHLPITDITRGHIREMLDAIDDEEQTRLHPFRVDNALKSARCIFNFAVMRDIIENSPADKIQRRCVSEARDRVLDDREVAALWVVTGEHGYPFGTATRVLLLTGQRRDEIGGMRWGQLDLDEGILKLAKVDTKSRRANEIPLSGAVVDLLRDVPHPRGEFVFRGRGIPCISGWSGYVARLRRGLVDRLGEVENWRLHDLKRTAATGLAKLGVDLTVIKLICEHQVGETMGVTAIYNRFHYMDEKRAALEKWAAVVVPPTPDPDGVIKLRRRA
ncbi:MAG: integrase arm-type DNA-binding domain-containing protein [Alphaproteobacteria bacterium]|nr:integrase arm-type DNA-binding domain-containing protein [Alphaproteobacteria bacterium]